MNTAAEPMPTCRRKALLFAGIVHGLHQIINRAHPFIDHALDTIFLGVLRQTARQCHGL